MSYESAVFDSELNLKSAQISTLLLDGARFGKNSKINLKDADFKRLKAPWNEIKDRVVYDPGVYLALIDNYRVLGWPSDEDDCYYKYRRLNQAEKGFRVFEGHRRFSLAVLCLRCSARLHCGMGGLDHPLFCPDLLDGRWHSQISQALAGPCRGGLRSGKSGFPQRPVFQYLYLPFSGANRLFANGKAQVLRHS